MDMIKQRILAVIMVLFMVSPVVVLADDNPFEKGENVNVGNNEWLIKDKTATRSGSSDGDFYHLFFDRKQLRLRITAGAEDSEISAREYQNLAIEDMQVDGKRLPLFQWCLVNQQKQSRFLQRGLKVKQNVCDNQGEKGTFVLRLNAATLDALKNAKTLTFKIRPFRTSINVNFDISDFQDMVAKLSTKVNVVQKPEVPAPVVVPDKIVAVKKCKANPPRDFIKIKAMEYACNDAGAKAEAEASVEAAVVKERKHQEKVAAERERKRKEAEQAAAAKLAKELADKKAAEDKLAAEQAALAATEASKLEMNADITNKMLAVCQKKWASGEHRCYCEKFLEHAPAGIQSDPSCAAK